MQVIKIYYLKLFLFFLPGAFSYSFAFGQKLVKADQFIFDPTITAYEKSILSVNLKEKGVLNLGKNSTGGKGGYSYTLELRKPDLQTVWETVFRVPAHENFLKMRVEDSRIALISVIHDEKQKQCQLQVTFYDMESGELMQEKILSENTIQPWQEVYEKGGIKQTFENIIESGYKKDFTTPLEYRYYVSFSPDNQKLLAYYFDFSQSELYAEAIIFNDQWEEEKRKRLPIDKGFLNSGISINNTGNLFLLNTKTDGTIAVIKVDPVSGNSDFLEISPSNSLRNSFNFSVEGNDHIIVSNLSYRNSRLSGLMFSRFNFKEKNIDWVKYHEISQTFNNAQDTTTKVQLTLENKNYELVEVYNNPDSKIFIIENRDYLAAGQALDYFGGDHINHRKPRKGKISTGDLIIMKFNIDQELNWMQAINKNQSNYSEEGLITLSFDSDLIDQELKILYAMDVGGATRLSHVTLNLSSGHLKTNELPNQHNLVLVRKYTHWQNPETLILAGKKGIKGKSSLILKYLL